MATTEIVVGGQVRTLHGDEDDDYFRGLRDAHEVLEPVVDAIQPFLRPDSTVVDVGANIGVYALGVAGAIPDGHIVACEPAPRTFEYLTQNLAGVPVETTPVPTAVAASPGRAQLSFTSYFAAGSHLDVNDDAPEATRAELIDVAVTTIDELVRTTCRGRVDVIKIDVEGYELEVLAGARETLRDHRPVVQLEFNHFAFTHHARLLPRDALAVLLETFPYLYVQARHDGRLARIDGPVDEYRLLWANAVLGPVDNLIGGFTELVPDAPAFGDAWQAFVEAPAPAPVRDPHVTEDPEVVHLRSEMAALHATVSWRVTRPLREIRRLQGAHRRQQP